MTGIEKEVKFFFHFSRHFCLQKTNMFVSYFLFHCFVLRDNFIFRTGGSLLLRICSFYMLRLLFGVLNKFFEKFPCAKNKKY